MCGGGKLRDVGASGTSRASRLTRPYVPQLSSTLTNSASARGDSSGTAGVTQTTYSSEFVDVNDATRDFRLVTGAAQKDTGTTDATNAAIDIAGTARPFGAAYDVGAW